jgi:hypothetical protein
MRQSPGFFTLSGYTTKPNKNRASPPSKIYYLSTRILLTRIANKIYFSSSFEYAMKQYIFMSYAAIAFFYIFGGLECVEHFFANVAQFLFLRDVWIRTQRAAVASRCATNLKIIMLLNTSLLNRVCAKYMRYRR